MLQRVSRTQEIVATCAGVIGIGTSVVLSGLYLAERDIEPLMLPLLVLVYLPGNVYFRLLDELRYLRVVHKR